jgi:DNA helicase HerA-like ATPase
MTGKLYEVVAEHGKGEPLQFFSVLYGLLKSRQGWFTSLPVMALEIHAAHGRVSFYVWLPNTELLSFVVPIFHAAYGNVELHEVQHNPMPTTEHGYVAVASVGLVRPSRYPIRTELEKTDLLSPLISMIGKPHGNNRIHISLLIRAKPNVWQPGARRKALNLRYGRHHSLWQEMLFGTTPNKSQGFFDEMMFGERQHRHLSRNPHSIELAKAIEEKASGPAFECELRIIAASTDPHHAWGYVRAALASLETFHGHNSFRLKRPISRTRFERRVRERSFSFGHAFLLSIPEIAALYHFPENVSPYVHTVRAPKLAPPSALAYGRIIGRTNYPELQREFGISIEDAQRHTYILGPTGSGKSTLLLNLIMQDIEAGRGVAVLDPKSDLVASVLARMPEHRINDVVLIEPDDLFSVGFNPLEETREEDVDLVTEEIIAIVRRIYSEYGWGSRMNETLKNSLLTLLRHKDMTLAHVVLLLTDRNFRRKMTARLNDPLLATYWKNFEQLSDYQRSEQMGTAMNRLRDVLLRGRVRRILCQKHSTFSFDTIVNQSGILLVDLNDSKYGPSSAALIGSLVFASLWQTGKKRSHILEERRKDFFLYVDEFQQFLGSARDFESVLAQARGFHIGLVLANQHFGQLPGVLRDAISSNARSKIVFQCGQEDARYLAREFTPLNDQGLQHLGKHEIAVKLSIAGEQSPPFTAVTLPAPQINDPAMAERVRQTAQKLYARRVMDIDSEVLAEFVAAQDGPDEEVGKR